MSTQNSSFFFCNKECDCFPCHSSMGDNLNCLFCFCPLYHMQDCGGAYILNENGIKDCGKCVFPHKPENYQSIIRKLAAQGSSSFGGGAC